jgi:hypothetical protein
MSYAAIRAFFTLDDGTTPTPVPTDLSNWLDAVTPSSQTEELDGTTFQPGVQDPIKDIIAGFHTRAIALGVKWTPAAETFFSGVEGLTGLNYLYGPLGNDLGMTAIQGLCNCLSWTGPVSTVNGVVTGSCELRATSREVGTFDASGAFVPATRAAEKAPKKHPA